MAVYQMARYHRRRAEALVALGGYCVVCKSTETLEFDHIIAETKSYDISKLFVSASNSKLQTEVAKCQILCHSCHLEKSQREGDANFVNHGEGATGKHNCTCVLCAPLKKAYRMKK
jgi:5-methylcytosine-specific restriction endonuclease McrA